MPRPPSRAGTKLLETGEFGQLTEARTHPVTNVDEVMARAPEHPPSALIAIMVRYHEMLKRFAKESRVSILVLGDGRAEIETGARHPRYPGRSDFTDNDEFLSAARKTLSGHELVSIPDMEAEIPAIASRLAARMHGNFEYARISILSDGNFISAVCGKDGQARIIDGAEKLQTWLCTVISQAEETAAA